MYFFPFNDIIIKPQSLRNIFTAVADILSAGLQIKPVLSYLTANSYFICTNEYQYPSRKVSANLYDTYHCCVYRQKFL